MLATAKRVTLEPHWSDPYVRMRDLAHELDCGELARLVQREVFGHEIRLPAARDYELAGGPLEKFRAMAAQIERCKDDVAARVSVPQEGDGVLLVSRGYRQHIGVHAWIAGERWVLHASDGSGQVQLQRERDLPIRGLRVEGYYQWL
jgi:hypothetical protein